MLPKAYQANQHEAKIYKLWEESGAFHHKIDHNKEPFCISMPPPNATGVLHTGHAVMLALEDIMTRYARMQGKCTLWLPGTDHAAIATQNKVEKILAKDGISRHDLGREKFLDHVREFVTQSQDTIRNQVRKMGSSCDWKRERYTFDEDLSHAVNEVFIRMYQDELIYRGYRIVNWCPRCGSTLADDEVEYKEVDAKLYHIQYGPFVIATSRPETKLGDTAVAVHPRDVRYQDYIGQELDIDLAGHKIKVKVIADHHVDMEFGSGAIGVTPAHSFVDFEMAQKNDVEIIQVINEAGNMTNKAGKYAGLSVSDCRKAFVADLEQAGLMIKEEPYKQNLSICYRCSATIEPLMSKQWFIDVNKAFEDKNGVKKSIKERSIEVVKSKEVEIVPDRFHKTYFHWMDELRDWCISRQIWWGHRIPVWYCQDCAEIMVGHQAPDQCSKCHSNNLKQDEDTLDTWFSSGLWTFSTLGWPHETDELKYFHPTSIMETGYDILFFWVARMIIMSTYALNEIPFRTVYLHGLIRTKDGKKMSKSHPETCINPLDVIEKYGADALRLSLVIGTTPGNDTKIFEEKIENYRNFVNKIWNSARFVLMNIKNPADIKIPEPKTLADKWICSRMQSVITEVTAKVDEYQYSEAGQILYDFIRNEFCDWYLEIGKVAKNESVMLYVLKTFLKLLHPFIPFVTEVLWEEMQENGLLINAGWPEVKANLINQEAEKEQELINALIKSIRNIRTENKVEAVKKIDLTLYGQKHTEVLKNNEEVIKRLARIENLNLQASGEKLDQAATNVVSNVEIYIPLAGMIDLEQEKTRLSKEIEDAEKYLKQLAGKLNNAKFVQNAPTEIVEGEKTKQKEAQARLEQLQTSLQQLS